MNFKNKVEAWLRPKSEVLIIIQNILSINKPNKIIKTIL